MTEAQPQEEAPVEGAEPESAKAPAKKRARKRTVNRVQNDVLRASMQDAMKGSFLNSGSDSTALLLAQMRAGATPTGPGDVPSGEDSSDAVLTSEHGVPVARTSDDSSNPSRPSPADIASADSAAEATPETAGPDEAADAGTATNASTGMEVEADTDTDTDTHADTDTEAAEAAAAETAAAEAAAAETAAAEAEAAAAETAAAEAEAAAAEAAAAETAAAEAAAEAAAAEAETAAAEAAAAEAAAAETEPPANTSPPKSRRVKTWAHEAINESFMDNRMPGADWETFGYRLLPDVKKRLENRVSADKRSSSNRRLAQGHYVNVAMLKAPKTTPERLELVTAFLRSRRGVTDPGKPTNYRVSRPVYEDSRDLDMEFTEAAKRGLVIYFFSAAVQNLLDAMDQEGPLARPDVFSPVQ